MQIAEVERRVDELFALTYSSAETPEADRFNGAPPPPKYLHLLDGGGNGG